MMTLERKVYVGTMIFDKGGINEIYYETKPYQIKGSLRNYLKEYAEPNSGFTDIKIVTLIQGEEENYE